MVADLKRTAGDGQTVNPSRPAFQTIRGLSFSTDGGTRLHATDHNRINARREILSAALSQGLPPQFWNWPRPGLRTRKCSTARRVTIVLVWTKQLFALLVIRFEGLGSRDKVLKPSVLMGSSTLEHFVTLARERF